MPIPLLVVVVIVVVAMVIWQRLRLKQGLAQNQDKNFGAIADRLGMRVEEGDPNTNLLYFMQKMGNYKRTLRANGQPYAHATSFVVMDGYESTNYLVYRRITHSYGCYLELKLKQPVAPFEVVRRNPNQYLIPNQDLSDRVQLRETPSGNPTIDAEFVIRTTDPRVAAALVPALQVLTPQLFVHLAGEGDQLWTNLTRMALPYFAGAVEEYLLGIETAACAIEGAPLPARIATPVLQPQLSVGQ